MSRDLPLIAEDLGFITGDVIALRERHGIPGMKVMQFAFAGGALDDQYLPQRYPDHCAAYTGTHDNDTVVGFFEAGGTGGAAPDPEELERRQRRILELTGSDGSEINWAFIRAVWQSAARLALAPMQDLLGLGSEARMNIPGKRGDFWSWRFAWEDLSPDLEQRLLGLTQQSGRCQ